MKAQNQTGFTPATREKKTFSMAITAPNTQQMITRALKDDRMAARFTSTLIGAVSASDALKKCDPGTIIAAGLRGEGMGLIYGHGYYIVPYDTVAQFSMGYKGYCQLAMSTGYYADIDCIEVREGELEGRSRRTGKPTINLAKYDTDEERESHKIIGYYAYYELKDGAFRYEYWSMDKLLRHADRYSPAFKLDKYNAMIVGELSADEQKKLLRGTPWYDVGGGQDKMCRKTMLRQLLNSGYAPLSNEVRSYFNEDSDDGVIPDVLPMGGQEPVVPTTGYVVDENTGEVHTKTAESAPVEPPVAAAMQEQGNDTPKTAKRTERPAEAETAARDYSAGFFGEGEL